MTNQPPSLLRRLTTNYAMSLLLWLVSTGLVLLDVLYGRVLLMAFFGLTGFNYWVLSFVDRAGILVLGLIGMSCSLFFEYYYRKGVATNQLWARFVRVTAIELLIIAAGIFVTWLTA